jgi:hypothetical protein
MGQERKGNYIRTHCGVKFYPLDPRPEDILIEDIAHALGNTCRYTGHSEEFYSVAQHATIISYQVPEEDALWGLLHDASEAYICDIARPVKRLPELAPYVKIEGELMAHIATKFGLPTEMPKAVHVADNRLLVTEMQQILKCPNEDWIWISKDYPEYHKMLIVPVGPIIAKSMFLTRFKELYEEK